MMSAVSVSIFEFMFKIWTFLWKQEIDLAMILEWPKIPSDYCDTFRNIVKTCLDLRLS